MRSVLLLSLRLGLRLGLGLGLGLGCGKAHRPPKGVAADELGCKRSGVDQSEVFETTWRSEDGVLRTRYRVGVSCSKPRSGQAPPKDLWQECAWVSERWRCGAWKSGAVEGGPVDRVPSSVYVEPSERGRVGN